MTKFAYNNVKNTSIGHMRFELSYGYHFCILFEEDINSRSQLKSAKNLLVELQNLMTVCQENLYYT